MWGSGTSGAPLLLWDGSEANMRSGRRPSPADKVAVGWYDQPYDISS